MFDVNTPRLLRALSHVKEVRTSLAEAEYLRRTRHQRTLQQNCMTHVQQLDHCISILPQQKATILAGLTARPVDLRQIHTAHETVRKLQQRIDALEQERQELEKSHQQACIDKDQAHRKFTGATRQQQKFKEIKARNDALTAQQSNEKEQDELEDRPCASALLLPDRLQIERK
jgi:hypothetical protein